MNQEACPSPVTDPERLRRLRAIGVLDTPAETAFDNMSTLVARLLDVPVALVSFVDEDRQFFKSCFGAIPEPWMSERETPLSHSFCRHVVDRSEPLIVEDARDHPLVRDNLAVSDLGVIAYAGMPIKTQDGVILGSLCAVDIRPRAWTEDEISSLSLAAESLNTEIALRDRLLQEHRLLNQVEASRVDAERAIAAKDRLLATVSHELRTPLSGVLGFAELLDDERLDDEQRSFLDTVRRSADQLLEAVDDLLRYVDLESGSSREERSPFHPSELVEGVAQALRHEVPPDGPRLSVTVAEDVPGVVVGDRERTRAAFAELLTNALRFTEQGEVAVTVSVVPTPDDTIELQIRVRDTGVGIDPARLQEIFEPLTGHDGSGGLARGGLGMGLATARQHAMALGGAIAVESTPGKGSVFTFTIPVEIPAEPRS